MKIVIGILIAVLVVGGATVLLMQRNAVPNKDEESTQVVGREEGVSLGEKKNTFLYTHPRYGFTLEFPNELAIERHPLGTASEVIVFEQEGEKRGFQIFATPYVGESITEERLQQDVKGGKIEEPAEVIIGDNQRALVFWSTDPSVGRLREVWFIHKGFLYEVSTYAEFDQWLGGVLQTWKFEE